MNPYKKNKIQQLASEYTKDIIAHFNIGNVRCVRIPSLRSCSDVILFVDEVQKCVNDIVGENVIVVKAYYHTNFIETCVFDHFISYFPYGEQPDKRDMTPFHELHEVDEELLAKDRYDNELRALSRERSKGKI